MRLAFIQSNGRLPHVFIKNSGGLIWRRFPAWWIVLGTFCIWQLTLCEAQKDGGDLGSSSKAGNGFGVESQVQPIRGSSAGQGRGQDQQSQLPAFQQGPGESHFRPVQTGTGDSNIGIDAGGSSGSTNSSDTSSNGDISIVPAGRNDGGRSGQESFAGTGSNAGTSSSNAFGSNGGTGSRPSGGTGASAGGMGTSPNGGTEISPNGGAGISPNGGAGISPNGGAGISPNGGAGISPNGGAGISPNGGAGISPNGSAGFGSESGASFGGGSPDGTGNGRAGLSRPGNIDGAHGGVEVAESGSLQPGAPSPILGTTGPSAGGSHPLLINLPHLWPRSSFPQQPDQSGDDAANNPLMKVVNEEYADAVKNLTEAGVLTEADYESRPVSDLFGQLLEKTISSNPTASEGDQRRLVHLTAIRFVELFESNAFITKNNVTELVYRVGEQLQSTTITINEGHPDVSAGFPSVTDSGSPLLSPFDAAAAHHEIPEFGSPATSQEQLNGTDFNETDASSSTKVSTVNRRPVGDTDGVDEFPGPPSSPDTTEQGSGGLQWSGGSGLGIPNIPLLPVEENNATGSLENGTINEEVANIPGFVPFGATPSPGDATVFPIDFPTPPPWESLGGPIVIGTDAADENATMSTSPDHQRPVINTAPELGSNVSTGLGDEGAAVTLTEPESNQTTSNNPLGNGFLPIGGGENGTAQGSVTESTNSSEIPLHLFPGSFEAGMPPEPVQSNVSNINLNISNEETSGVGPSEVEFPSGMVETSMPQANETNSTNPSDVVVIGNDRGQTVETLGNETGPAGFPVVTAPSAGVPPPGQFESGSGASPPPVDTTGENGGAGIALVTTTAPETTTSRTPATDAGTPSGANGQLVWSFKITDMEFDPELQNQQSESYKKLANDLIPDLTKLFQTLDPRRFVDVTIKRFSKGSVIVDGQTELTEQVDSSQLLENFMKLLADHKNTIGGHTVDPSSVSFDHRHSAPQAGATNSGSSGGTPNWVIALVVALVLLALVAVAVIIVLKRRKRQPHRENYMVDEETMNGGTKAWSSNPARPGQGQQAIRGPQLQNGRDQYAGVNMYEMREPSAPNAAAHLNYGYQPDRPVNGLGSHNRGVNETSLGNEASSKH